jgi:predicted nucleic acid-binding protein
MIDPPKVLLELSFLRAVTNPDDPHHHAATGEYRRLLDDYEREEVLLVAVSDQLCVVDGMRHPLRQIGLRRRGVFAPVDFLWVGLQHRRVARRSTIAADPQFALTLVMAERHRITRIATFDPRFDEFELETLPAAVDDAPDS